MLERDFSLVFGRPVGVTSVQGYLRSLKNTSPNWELEPRLVFSLNLFFQVVKMGSLVKESLISSIRESLELMAWLR